MCNEISLNIIMSGCRERFVDFSNATRDFNNTRFQGSFRI